MILLNYDMKEKKGCKVGVVVEDVRKSCEVRSSRAEGRLDGFMTKQFHLTEWSARRLIIRRGDG